MNSSTSFKKPPRKPLAQKLKNSLIKLSTQKCRITSAVDAVAPEEKQNNNNAAPVFTVADTATTKHSVGNSKTTATTKPKQKTLTQRKSMSTNQNAKRAAKCTKGKTLGVQQTQQTTQDAKDAYSPSPLIRLVNNRCPPLQHSKKIKIAAPTFRGKSRREGVHHRGSPKSIRTRLQD